DFVIFRWDRYVLTFGLYDQLRIFGGLRDAWSEFWSMFKREEKPEAPAPANGLEGLDPTSVLQPDTPRRLPNVSLPLALGLALLAAAAWVLYLRLRPPLTATTAYRRLRRRLGRAGPPLADSVPPLRLQHEAEL